MPVDPTKELWMDAQQYGLLSSDEKKLVAAAIETYENAVAAADQTYEISVAAAKKTLKESIADITLNQFGSKG